MIYDRFDHRALLDAPAPSCPIPGPLLVAAQAPCPQCGGRDITYRLGDADGPGGYAAWRWTCETCATWGTPGAVEGGP